MYVCVDCAVEMTCDKNDVAAAFGVHGHVYPGDRFVCGRCGRKILATNAAPSYDPEYKMHDEYLQMDSEPKHLGRTMCPECDSENVREDDLETESHRAVASYSCNAYGCEFHDNWRPVEREITLEGRKSDE